MPHLVLAIALLLISALPDAMVVPVLRQLMVDRFEVGIGAAHLFMTVNLVGAIVGVGLVASMRKRLGVTHAIALAAIANGSLLAIMTLPIGLTATLLVRSVEGFADLAVYAILFDYIARSGPPETNGRRLGAAVTFMMLGIAAGLGVGGLIGASNALNVLWAGAIACVVVASLAALWLRDRDLHTAPTAPPDTPGPARGPLWPALAMMLSDRALAGLLITTIPLYVTTILQLDSATTGVLIGSAMLMTALGAWPAGRLIDSIGAIPVRAVAGLLYAGGIAMLPFALHAGVAVGCGIMVTIGLGGAALFASSIHVVVSSRRGVAGMGAYHFAGNLGFLIGPMTAAGALTLLGGAHPDERAFIIVLAGFAILHGITTCVMVPIAWHNRRRATGDRPDSSQPVKIPASET